MNQKFTVMMQALKNLTRDKRKYREGEHVAAQTCQKRARTSAECPQVRARTSVESAEEQQQSSHQVSNENFTKSSSDTTHYGISVEEEFQEECIIPDQQNLADEIPELCSGNQVDPNIGSSEILLDNISQEFSSKEELGKPVSDKLSKIVNTLFLNNMEEEKFKTINKKYRRSEYCPNISVPKVNNEIWNENLQASHRMTVINLRKIQLLNVSAAYAVTEAYEKVVSRIGKYKEDLSKELLTPLVDSLAFTGKATKDTNQLRRDILKSRLPAKMKQLTNNVPAESELLFGDDLNKRISQINNINSALANSAFIRPNQNSDRYNKNQAPYITTSNNHQQSKNGYPPGGALLQGEMETSRATAETTGTKLSKLWW